jgi:hypothetical protein
MLKEKEEKERLDSLFFKQVKTENKFWSLYLIK